MFGKAKIQSSNVWKIKKTEFQYLEKPKSRVIVFGKADKSLISRVPVFKKPNSRIPMFGKAKIKNTNVKRSQNPEFECLQKQNPENYLVVLKKQKD